MARIWCLICPGGSEREEIGLKVLEVDDSVGDIYGDGWCRRKEGWVGKMTDEFHARQPGICVSLVDGDVYTRRG